MDIAITRMSSKGQVVIPNEMRKNIPNGEKMVIIKDGEKLIMKKASDFDKQLREDLEFARRTEEAIKRIESGEYIKVPADKLLEEMKKW